MQIVSNPQTNGYQCYHQCEHLPFPNTQETNTHTINPNSPTPTSNSNPKFWATKISNNCYYTYTNNNSIITINKPTRNKRKTIPPVAASVNMLLGGNPVLSDVIATAISGSVALGFLRLWQVTANYGVFDSKLNRKLVHISIGLVFMLCWPLFSSGYRGALLASLIPGINILRMLLLGFGLYKDEGTVKSMSRHGDHRELLKGPLYYASTITFACIFYWRTSPIGIAAICNLCAGDGMADIVGRRLGNQKLPFNKNKSFAGSIAMATAGFIASVGYMHYFSQFGFIQESWSMVLRFLLVSVATALVESLPISTELDDNLTVPLTSFLVGSLVF